MPQFYLLSVVSIILAGLNISGDYLSEKISMFSWLKELRIKKNTQIAIGLCTLAIGVLKFIFRSPGETVPVAGDLLPALGGILLGLVILGEAFQQETEKANASVKDVTRKVLTYRVPLGFAGVLIGLVHFFVPGVLIF